MQGFYSATLVALTGAQNERLWFKTQLKLCSLWFGLKEFSRAARILKELHRWARLCTLGPWHLGAGSAGLQGHQLRAHVLQQRAVADTTPQTGNGLSVVV